MRLIALAAITAVVAGGGADRSISWWWYAEDAAPAQTDEMLRWVRQNKGIVTTLIMECGVVSCVRNSTKGDCTNNGGVGGVITGELSGECKRALPVLDELGVRAELWLGEDDSISSARYMFAHAADTADALLHVAAEHPGIVGFNIDLETGASTTQADTEAFAGFLGTVTRALRQVNATWRFSADVTCGSTWAGLLGNCSYLAQSGVSRLMNMRTYNAAGFEQWWYAGLQPSLDVPRDVLGVGLGCWIDSRTNGTWNLTPESAKARLCMLANQSVQEIDMFVLKQGAGPDKASFPEPFWIEPLDAFMRGGGCNAAIPAPAKCPNASVGPPSSWAVSSADVGCCVASSRRGRDPSVKCDVGCAEAECAKAGMFWRPENYSTHPYECCLKPTPPPMPAPTPPISPGSQMPAP